MNRVCTTADVWTASQRSYIGKTVHWIDPSTLKRHKAAITCAQIIGCHTYDVLAAKIERFHQSFELSDKVSATVTDNGSNLSKLLPLLRFQMFPLYQNCQHHYWQPS